VRKDFEVRVSPKEAFDTDETRRVLREKFKLPAEFEVVLKRRSIDARKNKVQVGLSGSVFIDEIPVKDRYLIRRRNVNNADPVVIVGSGPAGMFAALRLIEHGIKPIIIERGKDVRSRRRDIAAINKEHRVDEDSNYCFGEGGAGTYSDGKLYTRSKKRGDVKKVIDILLEHGARDEISFESHPHIGTNKLPGIVQAIRETIQECGGEIYFDTRVVDLDIKSGEIASVIDQNGNKHKGLATILATGHSARDIYHLLVAKGVRVDPKPFAMGVRVEHPQEVIDGIQYHCDHRGDWLPAASYSLVNQTIVHGKKRGVFSFCMCPGGFIVPAATSPGEVVVNGMSPSRRNSKYANSGIVVAVELEDLKKYNQAGPLAGLQFQQEIEKRACQIAGGDQTAPAQRLADFLAGKVSPTLNSTSYQPGLKSVDMAEILPGNYIKRLRAGFSAFGKKMKGYITNDAQVVGVESRTSSPVWIPRSRETFEHLEIGRLFPSGEGAGYAGGIVSAAMDGMKTADKLVALYCEKEK